MAVTINNKAIRIAMKLANGSTATGAVKTVSVPFPSLNKEAFDAEKVMAIVDKISNCLNKTLYSVVKTEESELVSDE